VKATKSGLCPMVRFHSSSVAASGSDTTVLIYDMYVNV